MKGRVVVITGASSGIGRSAALAIAREGASLLLVCRDARKGAAAVSEIRSRTANRSVELAVADLSLLAGIRGAASEVRSRYPAVDVLINNAGLIIPARTLSPDGMEATFALNHLGYFLLTNLLLGVLTAAPAARIVNVASEAHKPGTIDFGDLMFEKGYNPFAAYARSKLANILFTYELARRLEGTTVTANAVHPGGVRTNFRKDLAGGIGLIFRALKIFMRSPEKGAETVVWLAMSPDVRGVTGKYFHDKKEIRSSEVSYDRDIAERLWEVSAALTGLEGPRAP